MFKQKEADNSSFAPRVGVHTRFYLEYDIVPSCTVYERLRSGRYRNFTMSLRVSEKYNFYCAIIYF